MMKAVVGDPPSGRVFKRAQRERGQHPLNTAGELEAAVGERSVVAEVDAERTENDGATQRKGQARPAEAPRQHRQQGQQMHSRDGNQIFPMDIVVDRLGSIDSGGHGQGDCWGRRRPSS
jgi:hypothetical protein